MSTLTLNPSPSSARTSPGRPGSSVGSPPQTTTPSSHALRALSDPSTASRSMTGWREGVKASEALWQVGQRRLHPPVKITDTFFPGQSHSDRGVTALMRAAGAGAPGWGGSGSVLIGGPV